MLSFHSVELRYRVMYICFSLVWSLWLIWDCCECLLFNLCSISLVYTSLYEGFVCFVWFTFLVGIVSHMPLIGYHGVCFLSCGLYEYEFKKCVKWVCCVLCIFNVCVLFCMWLVLPSLVSFFLDFESEYLVATIKIVDFVVVLGGLVQFSVMCCVIPFIPRVSRKLLYFGVLVLCAFLTPPDVVSLVLVSVPLIGVLEVSFLCRSI